MVFHDGWSATEVAKKVYFDDPDALEAAALHVLLDDMCSGDKVFHNQLKMWANMDARQRKKRRTSKRKKGKKEQIPASARKFEKNMKQLLELQRLARLIRS